MSQLDLHIMKLDTGDPLTWRAINRPRSGLRKCGRRSKRTRGITIQSFILDGPVQKVRSQASDRWVETVAWIAPQELQIYTADRPVAEARVEKVPKAILLEMAREAGIGIHARAY